MDPITAVGLIVLAWAAFGLLGAYVAQQKGRPVGEGLFLAVVFGPLGVVVAGLLPTLPDHPGGEGEEEEEEDEDEEPAVRRAPPGPPRRV